MTRLLPLMLLGCYPNSPAPADIVVERGPPTVTKSSISCDTESGRWSLSLTTDYWAGPVTTWWTSNGAYVERHAIQSTTFNEDGTLENFSSSISFVTDWADYRSGSTTAFFCTDDVSILITVENTDGQTTDCVLWPSDDEPLLNQQQREFCPAETVEMEGF